MLFSVCLIVKNEAHQLTRSLKSIPSECEIIVVDTGSTDSTIDIVKEAGAQLFHYEWNDDFSAARNYSISKASGKYIFIMDADEELSDDWLNKVGVHIELYPHKASTVMIHNIGNKETSRHRMVRLFPNDFRYRYKGRVHEQVYCENEVTSVVHSDISITHYGYVEDEYRNKGKFERYLALYMRSLEEEPNNGYMLYQLGKLYYSAGKYREAYEPLARCADLQQFEMSYYAPMIVMLGYTLKEFGYSKEAFEILEPLLSLYPKFPDLPFALGMLAMEAGLFDRIEECFKTALSIGDTDKYTSIIGVGSFRASHNLGVYYDVSGKRELAREFYLQAASCGFEPSIARMYSK